jgi:hypothetical protein
MNKIINSTSCLKCNQLFNSKTQEPKILPCSHLLCKQCLDSNEKELGYYLVKCCACAKTHEMANLTDLPTSMLISNVLLSQEIEEDISEDDSTNVLRKNKRIKLDSHLNELDTYLRVEKFEINKHYDSVINDIDIRAESLINYIHKYRETLQEKVNYERKRTIEQIDCSDEKQEPTNSKFLQLKNNVESHKEKSDETKYTIESFHSLASDMHKLQSFIFNVKKSCWYFVDSHLKLDKSLLGHNLNVNLDRNYFKIKNLNDLLQDEFSYKKITFKSEFEQPSLRHKIIPLGKDKIIKIYFTAKRSLCLQLFNSEGELIKEAPPVENLSSFPVSYGYGSHFVVCFTAKNNESSQYFFETSSTHVNLYNSDLSLVKSLKKFSSIESVFMNENCIVVTHSHRSDGCCSIYDYRLNELALFGQQKDKDADYYMERLNLSWKEQNSLNYKINPKVFGLTENLIYFYNHAEMTIMDRIKGKVVHKKQIMSGDKPYFILDTQGNIIQVNKLSKKVSVFNFDVEFSIENNYDDCYDGVFSTCDGHLALVNGQKKFLVLI